MRCSAGIPVTPRRWTSWERPRLSRRNLRRRSVPPSGAESGPGEPPGSPGAEPGPTEENHLDEAETLARRALALRPDDASAMVLLAEILSRSPRGAPARDEALGLLSRAAALAPDLLEVRWATARALCAAGRWKDALPELGAVLRADPGKTEVYFLLSQASRQLGQEREGREAAALFRQREAQDREIRVLTGRVAADPENPALRFRLGELQAASGHLGFAIQSYRSGLARDPRNQRARKRLGQLQAMAAPT